ncbi:MAG: sugar phosphate isomerase/epimerase, partial [Candidatus Handelsmanbacteria bacterium]|nr:sugar phosphate isomerase/epimerase [Candidatus Handelsmanbacteria bacterium]
MKIALQEGLLPGQTLAEKLDFAESIGVEGLEVGGCGFDADKVRHYEQALQGRQIRLTTVCGQSTFDWLDPDVHKRRASVEESKRVLDGCSHFKAVGHVMPPIFGPPRLPDLWPLKDAIALEKELLV